MLKIISPFREKEEVIPLIDAGADELYCGYLSPEWERTYTSLEFERKGGRSNFTDLRELKDAVKLAHKRDVPVYLTLNGLYVRSQYPLLVKIVKQLEDVDLDAYIIADIGLLLTLKEMGTSKQVHISTGGTVFNSEAVDFYKDLGASRIILDRQTTFKSMRELCKNNPDVEFETFILNTLCVYIDGFCTFMHASGGESIERISKNDWEKEAEIRIFSGYGPEPQADACCLDYSVEVFNPSLDRKIDANGIKPTFYKQLTDGPECGACALHDIMYTGVKSVKIVGRQLIPEVRLVSTRFIRSVLDILEANNDINRGDFIHRVQKVYQKTFEYKHACRGNNCYHPEVLFYGR